LLLDIRLFEYSLRYREILPVAMLRAGGLALRLTSRGSASALCGWSRAFGMADVRAECFVNGTMRHATVRDFSVFDSCHAKHVKVVRTVMEDGAYLARIAAMPPSSIRISLSASSSLRVLGFV